MCGTKFFAKSTFIVHSPTTGVHQLPVSLWWFDSKIKLFQTNYIQQQSVRYKKNSFEVFSH